MVVGTDDQRPIQASLRENDVQVNVDVFELTDFHQVHPVLCDVVLDSLLELFVVFDSFNRIALGARMDRDNSTKFTCELGALLDWNVNFLVTALVVNSCPG